MIYTLTINPSIDYIVDVKNFQSGSVNRTSAEKILAGGKGINVSLVLKNLGVKNIALGFTAGFTGQEIETILQKKNLKTDFIHLENGMSRINVKLHSTDETEINGAGPAIEKKFVDQLFEKLNQLQDDDILVLAGSIPNTLDKNLYSLIMEKLSSKKINFVVDATGELLCNSLKHKPFLIKPNNFELSELFNAQVSDKKSAVPLMMELQKSGAQNILVSFAKDGAILLTNDGQIFESDAPTGTVVNSVGAGDSMVAGFLAGWIKSNDFSTALKNGILCGSASTFSGELATQESVDLLEKSWRAK